MLADRITRASCFVCANAADAVALAALVDAETGAMRDWLAGSTDPSLSRHARLREVDTHVVGPMCHVLWRWTTGDAVGPNMMTRNAYALNMGYVMQRAPVKPERAILEANMGGDKKPSHEYFRSGHGKSVLAEAFLSDEQIRRVLRTTAADLEALSWAGTHGSVASGMQSVAFTPASAIAAVFAATGQDLGMVGPSSMAQGTGRRVEGGLAGLDPLRWARGGTVGGGTTLPSAREWLASIGCAGPGKVYRLAQIISCGGPLPGAQCSAAMATAGSENFFQAHHERGGLVIASSSLRDRRAGAVRGGVRRRAAAGRSSSARPGLHRHRAARRPRTGRRYLVVDRWESGEPYNRFVAEHRDEYMRRVDETAFLYRQELRLGTFENVWTDDTSRRTMTRPASAAATIRAGFTCRCRRAPGLTEYEAYFSFDGRHQGGPGIVHGGLVSAALDEAAGLLATGTRSRP